MIISKRDEGMSVACRGLIGDLVVFSSMFKGGWGEWKIVLHSVLIENIVRGNKGRRRTDTRRSSMRENEKMMATIFIRTWSEGQAKGEKSVSQWAMNQGWERRGVSEFIAILLFCCSVFFLLTQWTCREQAAFFIGHMPLHNDLWMLALCRLILLSMHYVAQPSVAIWGEKGSIPPHFHSSHLCYLLLSHPPCHSPFPSQLFPLSPSLPLWLKAFQRWCKATKVGRERVFIQSHPGLCPVNVLCPCTHLRFDYSSIQNSGNSKYIFFHSLINPTDD